MKCLLQRQYLSHVKRIAITIPNHTNIFIHAYDTYFQIDFGDTNICQRFCHIIIIICLRDAYWAFDSFTNSLHKRIQQVHSVYVFSNVHSSYLSRPVPLHANFIGENLQHCFFVDEFETINAFHFYTILCITVSGTTKDKWVKKVWNFGWFLSHFVICSLKNGELIVCWMPAEHCHQIEMCWFVDIIHKDIPCPLHVE